jgi:hypothetical protein
LVKGGKDYSIHVFMNYDYIIIGGGAADFITLNASTYQSH